MQQKYIIDYVGGRDQGFKTINTVINAASLWEAAKVARRLHGLFFITAKRIFTTETETLGYYLRARKDNDVFTQATAYVSRFTGKGA